MPLWGVDIEAEDPARDIVGISQSAFHPSDHLWLLRQSETARLAAFYHLWCTREALYKLMSSLGSETVLSPLVGANGAFASQGPGWHRYTLAHSFLRVAVCSDRPLAAIHKVELTRLARAEWLAADREFRSTSVTTLPHEVKREATRLSAGFALSLGFIKEARGQTSLMGRARSAADGRPAFKDPSPCPLVSPRSLHGFTLVPLRIFS